MNEADDTDLFFPSIICKLLNFVSLVRRWKGGGWMTKWHEIMKTVAIGIKVILRVMPGSLSLV
jgi:hypothetical protein